MGTLTMAATGQPIKYRFRVEFGGDQRPPDDQIKKVQDILREICDDLDLK